MDIPFETEEDLSQYLQEDYNLLKEEANKLAEVLFEAYFLGQTEQEVIQSISFHVKAELHQNPGFIHVIAKFLERSRLLFNS